MPVALRVTWTTSLKSLSGKAEWLNHEKPLYAGIATTYLYREELQPIDDIRDRVSEMKTLAAEDAKGRAEKARAIRTSFDTMKPHLASVAPEVEKEIAVLVDAVVANDGRSTTNAALDGLAARMSKLRTDLPPGYFQPEKLLKAIEAGEKPNRMGS